MPTYSWLGDYSGSGLNYNLNTADTSFQINAPKYDWGQADTSIMATTIDWVKGASLGYQAVSSAANIYLSYQKAKNSKRIAKYQAELYQIQAQSYKNAAEDALREGNRQVASITFAAGQKKASTKVAMAASGIQVGAGSSAEVLASQDIAKEIQVNQVLANAVTTSFGYRRQQVNYSNKAIAQQAAANNISPWAVAVTEALDTLAEAPNEIEGSTGSVALDRWVTIGKNAKNALGV